MVVGELHAAAASGDSMRVRRLLSNGISASVMDDLGRTPLHAAGSAAVAQVLVLAGGELNAVDKEGNSTLHAAAAAGVPEVVEWSLSKGVVAEAQNHAGNTPLHVAAAASEEVTKVLVRHRANVHARNHAGETALHHATNGSIVLLLAEAGADVGIALSTFRSVARNCDLPSSGASITRGPGKGRSGTATFGSGGKAAAKAALQEINRATRLAKDGSISLAIAVIDALCGTSSVSDAAALAPSPAGSRAPTFKPTAVTVSSGDPLWGQAQRECARFEAGRGRLMQALARLNLAAQPAAASASVLAERAQLLITLGRFTDAEADIGHLQKISVFEDVLDDVFGLRKAVVAARAAAEGADDRLCGALLPRLS